MKYIHSLRSWLAAFLFILIIAPALPVFAVNESCAVQAQTGTDGLTYYIYEGFLIVKCTAASDDASMSYTFGARTTSDGQLMGLLDGRRVLGAFSYDGTGTDPTASSELTVTDSDGVVYVNPATNGLNIITNGTDTSYYWLGPDGNAGFPVMHGSRPLTWLWTNNAVNSGINYHRLEVTGPRFVK